MFVVCLSNKYVFSLDLGENFKNARDGVFSTPLIRSDRKSAFRRFSRSDRNSAFGPTSACSIPYYDSTVPVTPIRDIEKLVLDKSVSSVGIVLEGGKKSPESFDK